MTFKNHKSSEFERTIKWKFGKASIYIHCTSQLIWDSVLERLEENNICFFGTSGNQYYTKHKKDTVACVEKSKNAYSLHYGNKKEINTYSDNPLLVTSKQFLDSTKNKTHRIRIITKCVNIK